MKGDTGGGREREGGGKKWRSFGNQGKGHRERPSEVEVTHKNQNSAQDVIT